MERTIRQPKSTTGRCKEMFLSLDNRSTLRYYLHCMPMRSLSAFHQGDLHRPFAQGIDVWERPYMHVVPTSYYYLPAHNQYYFGSIASAVFDTKASEELYLLLFFGVVVHPAIQKENRANIHMSRPQKKTQYRTTRTWLIHTLPPTKFKVLAGHLFATLLLLLPLDVLAIHLHRPDPTNVSLYPWWKVLASTPKRVVGTISYRLNHSNDDDEKRRK